MKKRKYSLFGKDNKRIRFKRNIALSYFSMVLLGTILLFLPISTLGDSDVSLVDAFFVSASSFTDTGLTPVVINETFNTFGHIVILVLVQIGALGLMTMKAILFLIVNRKISTSDRMMIYTEHKQTKTSGMVKLIKDAALIMFICQITFTIIIAAHMMINYGYNIGEGLWFSYFHTTAALTNAGFDLTGNSLYNFSTDYIFQIYIMILIVIGGLGFPVLIDIKRYIISKKEKTFFRFSLFSKISLTTYFAVTIFGLIAILLLDYDMIFNEAGGLKGFFYALFQVISSRSSGLATTDLDIFSSGSHMILIILMFIGAAPASTGGGIRTTTLALIVLYLVNYASNKTDVEAFNRRIPKETIFSAFVNVCIAGFMVFFASLLIIGLNSEISILAVIFEVASAFGTTGLTMGITAEFEWIAKIIIAFLMMIGQLGITNALMIIARNKEDSNLIRLPEENIAIG